MRRWSSKLYQSTFGAKTILLAVIAAATGASGALGAGRRPADPAEAFRPCSICHAVGPGADVSVGPPLNGILGKPWANNPAFTYSAGMRAGRQAGRVWDEATLDAWIEKPRAILPDTKMAFPGLADRKNRQAIIGYLQRVDENGQLH